MVALSVGTLGPRAAHAQVGPRALPTLLSTPQPASPDALSFMLAAVAGYGLREPQSKEDALHHTGLAGIGAAVAAPWGLAAELRLDGRLEEHTAQGDRGSGMVGELRAYLRYAHALGSRVRLGGELGVWVPGSAAPSLRFSATTLDALLALDAQLGKGWSLLFAAGFRLDQSAQAFAHPERLSTGDYVTLGLSDSHAVLARAGVVRAFDRGQLFLEWSWDALIGVDAPRLSTSPMQAALGGRAALTHDARLSLVIAARALLSPRPTLDMEGPLVPFPPRAELWCGLRFETGKRATVAAAPAESTPESAAVALVAVPVAVPRSAPLHLRVLVANGTPVVDASVQLDGAAPSSSDATGELSFADVGFGAHSVRVTADGFLPFEQTLQHDADHPLQTVTLAPNPPTGQLRLLVRDHRSGEPLRAEVRVREDTESGAEPSVQKVGVDGRLLLDLPPGRYVVVVKLEGYRKQRKQLEVEDKSVTILDVALHARSKR